MINMIIIFSLLTELKNIFVKVVFKIKYEDEHQMAENKNFD